MACTKETVKAFGLNIWSTGAPPGSTTDVDIVGVQGLGSHPFFTWVKKVQAPESKPSRKLLDKLWSKKDKKTPKQDEQNGPTEFMWPRDLLVPLFTNARVATYSYKSGKGVKTTLRQLAEQFLNVLFQHRQKPDERQRPLILIGHSLGGLVIQQALVIAALNRDFQELRLSVSGVIFLGAPFQGSNAAVLGKRLAQVTGGDLSLLELLQKDNPNLHSLSKDFCDSHHEWDFVCFYEDTDADYTLFKTRVVTASSATLSGRRMIFLNTDHSGLNKFSGENDENYALLLPEIQRMVDNGHSIVTSRHQPKEGEVAGNKHWLVPRGVNKLFTGRSEIIDRIKGAIQDDDANHGDKQKVFVITGLGGMGKSEICLQVANILREEFWGVFWVDVNSDSIAKSDFISAAAAFGSSADSIDDARRLFSNTQHSWLLILDNADDPETDYQAYLPSGSRGVVIITSRVSDCSQYNTVGSEELTSLDIGLSKQLLLRAANIDEDLWPSVDQQAEAIANLIGSHTLALITAGSYIAQGFCQLDKYPEVYGKQRKRLLTHRITQARPRYGDVYATFEASANALEVSGGEDAKDALRLLGILSMVHSSDFPLQMFEYAWGRARKAIKVSDSESTIETVCQWHALQLPEFMEVEANEWDPYRLNKATYLLVSLSFVVRRNSPGRSPSLSMHPLAHAWAKDRQDLSQQHKTWISAACIISLPVYDYNGSKDPVPHIQSLLGNMETKSALPLAPKPTMVISILIRCAQCLSQNRDDSRLNSLLQGIFGALAIEHDSPSMEYMPLYRLYAISLKYLDDMPNFLKLQDQIVKLQEELLPSTHPDRITSQLELARAYLANAEMAFLKDEQAKKVIEILEPLIKIQEEAQPFDHPERLSSQHELARAYYMDGQEQKAIDLLERVVKIREENLPIDDPERLLSQHRLACIYSDNGQVKRAMELLEHVVKIKEGVLPIAHPDLLASQIGLARTYLTDRQVEKSINLLEGMVKVGEGALTMDNPGRLQSLHQLACAYHMNRQMGKAVELLEHVVKIREGVLPATHANLLASQHQLAHAYIWDGQGQKAIKLLEHVMEIKETVLALPTAHPSQLATQLELVRAYNADGQGEKGVKLLEYVVKINEGTLAIDNPDLLALQVELALKYLKLGQVKGIKLLEDVVRIQEGTLPISDSTQLMLQYRLGSAYIEHEQLEKAIEFLEKVLKTKEGILPTNHSNWLTLQHDLARAYHKNGQVDKAMELMEHVVEVRKELPVDDFNRCTSERVLARFKAEA